MFSFIGDLLEGAGDLLGGVAGKVGGLWGGPGAGGLLGLAAKIFGGSDDDPWGILDSPVFGHVVGAVGAELLRDDPVEQAAAIDRARMENTRRYAYGLPAKPGMTPSGEIRTPPAEAQPPRRTTDLTGQKFPGSELAPMGGLLNPKRVADSYMPQRGMR